MPEDSPSIYTIMAERVANAVLGKINALIGSHNTNEQAHQDIREDIPSATSELNNDSGFITSSSVPNPSSTTPSADTTSGSVGTGTTWARSNHTHPQSSLYADANHTHKNLEKTTITSGNLDDYTDTGWYSYSTANSSSITNTPENVGSVMEVLDDYGNGRYIVQKVYTLPSDNNSIIYYRQKYDTSWGDWKKIIDTDDASTTTPLGIRVNTSAITGSSTEYARADHQHTLTQFKCNGTAGSNGYIKVFQIKINSTYQDSPISFSLMQRGTKQSADVNIRFANENSNDPTLDSFTFDGSNIGNNGEYYLYKESASTWSFIVRKWDTHDVINIYNMSTTNGSVAITSLNTQVSELPSGCIPASMIKNDLFFKTKNGSTSNYINLFEIRPTGNYQAKPITFEIVRNTKPTPVYVSVRLTNVTLASNTYAPQTIWSWGTSDTPVYIRKEANNVFNVIVFHNANEEISVCNMNNPNQNVEITPLGTVYGTDAPATSGDNQVWRDTYTVGGTTFGTGTYNVIRGNDSRLSDTRNPKSTKISAGSDLNTYTTTGFYYNNSNTDCATITPLPQPDKAFFLQVEDWGTSNYTKQTITHYDPVKTYERIRNAGTWRDWHELQHNDGTGGENLLRTEPNNEGNSGVAYTIADEIFHNDKVYYRNETSQDTTKYSGWTWVIPRNEFDYGDVFTLSFYAKGTSDAEIRTYFAGASGYISNRRISSNSDVDNNVSSYGDGATRFHLTSDWKRYYVTYQLHTTATTPTQNKSIHIRTFGASTDIEFYISNVKLERGYYATDYDRHTRDNEPLYFPTEVSLPTTTTTEIRRKFIHPPYKFKNIPNWTVEGEIKVTGSSARFELHKTDDTNNKNFIALGKNGSGVLAYWWGTSSSAESSKTYSASDIEVDTWYPFRISRMGNNVLFMFNDGYKHEVTTTYFNTFEYIEPLIFGYGTSGASVRNLKITPLEPIHPLSPSSSVCTNAQGIITTESKNNHTHSDTQLNWNGAATNNSVSPLLMAMDSEFGANRLAYFPSSRIKVEYSTDDGSTWTELTTGNYSEANKTKLVTTTSPNMQLGNGSTTDYSKNSLRITFDAGDMNADSVLYLVTRKIALYTGTANSTGFTCQIQIQTYAQYNSNSETFNNYGSPFALGGWSGWNTYPINFTLGGYKSGNQTNSSSTRIKAIRLMFTQTGGTGNGIVSRVRLYGETAYKTASQYANNNHIYTINEDQDVTFPSKIIKKSGTSSQFLMANGDIQNKVTSWSNTPSDNNIASEKLVKTELEEINYAVESIQETIGANSPQIMKVEYMETQYGNTDGRLLYIQLTCDVPITSGNIVAVSNDGVSGSISTPSDSGSTNVILCSFGAYDADASDTFNIVLKNSISETNDRVITDGYSFSHTFGNTNSNWVDTGYVNNSYSIRNEINSLGNEIDSLNTSLTNKTEDTGWKSITNASGFSTYDNASPTRYRRIGKIVHIEGIYKNSSNLASGSSTVMGTISDTSCRPRYDQRALMQGSGKNFFLLTVKTNGQIVIERYGTTANAQTTSGSWLHCYITYFVE